MLLICRYCEKEINPNHEHWNNKKEGKTYHYHDKCLIEHITLDCSKEEECRQTFFDNHEPDRYEGF